MRVLVVDDNVVNLRIAQKILECLGVEADAYHSPREALEVYASVAYDAVFLDLQMPEMDGFRLLDAARARLPDVSVPFIACTAHATESQRDKILACGFDDCIIKPLLSDNMRESLQRMGLLKNEDSPKEDWPNIS